MTGSLIGPTEAIRRRVRELRRRKGWTGEQLAEEMRRVGVPWSPSLVANFESGRRPEVTVRELLALAYVLDVAVVHLLVPVEGTEMYLVLPDDAFMPVEVRRFIRGEEPLLGQNPRTFFAEVPLTEVPLTGRERHSPRWTVTDVDREAADVERERGES